MSAPVPAELPQPPSHPAPLACQSSASPLLVPWLALLCSLAAAAALQSLLLPRWPRAQELPRARLTALLRQVEPRVKALPPRPDQRGYERSRSALLAWRLPGGNELRLVQASARQRDSFQAAFLGRDQPLLALQQRRLDRPTPGSASGRIQGRPALQTCLVPAPQGPATAAVTAVALGRAADRRVANRTDTVRGLLGLQPTREFSCLLVTLRSGSAQPLPPALWQQLLQLLQASMAHA